MVKYELAKFIYKVGALTRRTPHNQPVKEAALQTKEVRLTRLGAANIDLSKLAGMTVIGGSVLLTEIIAPDTRPGSIQIPQLVATHPTATFVRSLQCKKGYTVVSLNGPFTTPVRDAVVILGQIMMDANVTATFLPVSTHTDRPGRKYAGFAAVGDLPNLDERAHNVRLLSENDGGTIFSIENKVRFLPFSRTNEDWLAGSEVIHEAQGFIKFLGRVENNRVPVTLESGQAYFMQVANNGVKPESPLPDRYTKVFGMTGDGAYIVALQGNSLTIQ